MSLPAVGEHVHYVLPIMFPGQPGNPHRLMLVTDVNTQLETIDGMVFVMPEDDVLGMTDGGVKCLVSRQGVLENTTTLEVGSFHAYDIVHE